MMRILVALFAVGIGQAMTLNELQLDGLLTGNTIYLNVPAGGPALPRVESSPLNMALKVPLPLRFHHK